MQTDHTVKLQIGKLLARSGIASGLLVLMLLACAAFAPGNSFLTAHLNRAGEGCLLVSAVLCGALCAGTGNGHRLMAALAGNGAVLVILLALGCAMKVPMGGKELLTDILILVFGSFAGALLTGNGRRRGSRKRR